MLDFPGICKLMKNPGSGAIKACPWCNISGQYCKSLCKTVYLDNQWYLDKENVSRECSDFAKKTSEDTGIYSLSHEEETQLRNDYDSLPNENRRKKFAREHGVKGTYSLMNLPYRRYHKHVQHDGMHTIKDVMEHIIDWLIGIPKEASLNSAESELRPTKRIRSDMVATLTKTEKERCNERCRNLNFPRGYSGFMGNVFTKPKHVHKKTHGWIEVFNYL